MSDMPENTPLTPKGGWRRKQDSAIDTIRNSAASGEWTDAAPLTPAEAMRLCPEVAKLVKEAKYAKGGFTWASTTRNRLAKALAPFTEGMD